MQNLYLKKKPDFLKKIWSFNGQKDENIITKNLYLDLNLIKILCVSLVKPICKISVKSFFGKVAVL